MNTMKGNDMAETINNDSGADRPSSGGGRPEGVERSAANDTPKSMKRLFGLIMVVIYLGMGSLCLSGFFDELFGSLTRLQQSFGLLFILYGFWRAYRYFRRS